MPRAEQPLSTAEIAQLVGDVLPRLIQAARAHSVNVRRLMMGLCTVVQALSSCGKPHYSCCPIRVRARSACARNHWQPSVRLRLRLRLGSASLQSTPSQAPQPFRLNTP